MGYVKRNAVAGRSFESFAALEAHLDRWTRETADRRVHGTTGEAPMARFVRDEAAALRPLPDRGPFLARARAEPARRGRLRGGGRHERLLGAVASDRGARPRAGHREDRGDRPRRRRGRPSTPAPPAGTAASPSAPTSPGVAGAEGAAVRRITVGASAAPVAVPALLRPLAEYEALVGGGW